MKRILAFGDSIMKGVVTDRSAGTAGRIRYTISDDCFTEQCSRRLGVEIDNFGKFGSTVSTGRKILDRHIRDICSDETVLLEYGGNDSAYNWNEIGRNPDGQHSPNTGLEAFRQQYLSMIEDILSKGARPVILSLPPVDPDRYYAHVLTDMSEEEKGNVKRWLGGRASYIYNWHEIYNLELFKLAAANNIPIIDITSAFLGRRNFRSMLCEDGMHPNEKGHRLIADTICESLAPHKT